MARCGCTSGCSCSVTSLDSPSIDVSVTGNGAPGSPYVVSAAAILVPDGIGPLSGTNALKEDALGLYVDPEAGGSGGFTIGEDSLRYSGGDPLAVVADVFTNFGSFLDTQENQDGDPGAGITGLTWSDPDARYDVSIGGFFFIRGEVNISEQGITTGMAYPYLNLRANSDYNATVYGPNLPYGSGVDTKLSVNASLYIAPGGFIGLGIVSTENVNVASASLQILKQTI